MCHMYHRTANAMQLQHNQFGDTSTADPVLASPAAGLYSHQLSLIYLVNASQALSV
jgi:hypothetical protein